MSPQHPVVACSEDAEGSGASNHGSGSGSGSDSSSDEPEEPAFVRARAGFHRIPGFYADGDGEFGHDDVIGSCRVPTVDCISHGKPVTSVLEELLTQWQEQFVASAEHLSRDKQPTAEQMHKLLSLIHKCYALAKRATEAVDDGVVDSGAMMRRFLLQLSRLNLPFAFNHATALFYPPNAAPNIPAPPRPSAQLTAGAAKPAATNGETIGSPAASGQPPATPPSVAPTPAPEAPIPDVAAGHATATTIATPVAKAEPVAAARVVVAPPPKRDQHCYECGRIGDFINCTSCSRVYHLQCIDGDAKGNADPLPTPWTCKLCSTGLGTQGQEWWARAGAAVFDLLKGCSAIVDCQEQYQLEAIPQNPNGIPVLSMSTMVPFTLAEVSDKLVQEQEQLTKFVDAWDAKEKGVGAMMADYKRSNDVTSKSVQLLDQQAVTETAAAAKKAKAQVQRWLMLVGL